MKRLGARAVLGTTAVGAVDPGIPLGRPILFDDLFFPENRLPGGAPRTVFPRLRRKVKLAAESLGLEITVGGVYGHTNGPRFETRDEIRWLNAVG